MKTIDVQKVQESIDSLKVQLAALSAGEEAPPDGMTVDEARQSISRHLNSLYIILAEAGA